MTHRLYSPKNMRAVNQYLMAIELAILSKQLDIVSDNCTIAQCCSSVNYNCPSCILAGDSPFSKWRCYSIHYDMLSPSLNMYLSSPSINADIDDEDMELLTSYYKHLLSNITDNIGVLNLPIQPLNEV